MKKKILAPFLVCAMALGSALPALAAEDTQPCEHIGMSTDGSYCNDCGTHYIMQQPSDDAYYVSVYPTFRVWLMLQSSRAAFTAL